MTFADGGRPVLSRAHLAPLAGYTQLAFRLALRELGGLGLATTELARGKMLLAGHPVTLEAVATCPADQPLSVQVYGQDELEVAEAARWIEARGYQGIDLNLGCPMGRIVGRGGGAAGTRDVESACRLVRGAVEAVRIPVTVKMRLGWDRSSMRVGLLARAFEEAGVAGLTVHGRTRQQGFGGPVDLDGIRAAVEAVRAIPVVGNGDVRTVEDFVRMRRVTGCQAVAIGRGAMLDPWIFRRIASFEGGGDPGPDPTAADQIEFLSRHYRLLVERHGERACVLFRKFAGWYGPRLGIPEDLEDRLRRIESNGAFERALEEIARRHGQRRDPVATALLRPPRGPVERR